MAEQTNEQKEILDRALYKKIKQMNRQDMADVLKNIYQTGYNDALNNGIIDLDTDQLRSAIGQIKGIGESRLNEIMSIIEKFVSGK